MLASARVRAEQRPDRLSRTHVQTCWRPPQPSVGPIKVRRSVVGLEQIQPSAEKKSRQTTPPPSPPSRHQTPSSAETGLQLTCSGFYLFIFNPQQDNTGAFQDRRHVRLCGSHGGELGGATALLDRSGSTTQTFEEFGARRRFFPVTSEDPSGTVNPSCHYGMYKGRREVHRARRPWNQRLHRAAGRT